MIFLPLTDLFKHTDPNDLGRSREEKSVFNKVINPTDFHTQTHIEQQTKKIAKLKYCYEMLKLIFEKWWQLLRSQTVTRIDKFDSERCVNFTVNPIKSLCRGNPVSKIHSRVFAMGIGYKVHVCFQF